MKTFPGKLFLVLFCMAILACLPALVHAQVGDPGCEPGDPTCPIDSGLVFLLAAGVAYGIKKSGLSRKKGEAIT